jgi:FtsP/CotA-like multicopper oxidase with cupredoxin domain
MLISRFVTATGKGKHIEFNDVGQNTVELWTLESGGGWIHPIHIHLVVHFLSPLLLAACLL